MTLETVPTWAGQRDVVPQPVDEQPSSAVHRLRAQMLSDAWHSLLIDTFDALAAS